MRAVYTLEQWQELTESIFRNYFKLKWLPADHYVYATAGELLVGKFNTTTNQGFIYAKPRKV